MTRAEYVQAVAQASQALATGELEWGGHYARIRELQSAYSTEHRPSGWPGVVQDAYRQQPGQVAS